MIDEATVEQWMREANPIPTLDDVDADEFARFVAAAHTRRAAVMQAPTQHPTPTTPDIRPPTRRRKAWAFAAGFVMILLVVGAAALFLQGDNTPLADEPATPTTVTTPEVATTAADEAESTPPAELKTPVVADGWQQVATLTEHPWIDGISQIEALPGGGYVAIGGDSVMWSPNGVDWYDGDPQRLVRNVELGPFTASLAVVGDQVIVLHNSSPDEIGLSIGDPRTGTWERVPLDLTGIDLNLHCPIITPGCVAARLAANDNEVLVAAYAAPASNAEGQAAASRRVTVWVVDAARGTSTRNSFPILATRGIEGEAPLIAWVEERWIMIALDNAVGRQQDGQGNTLWTSPDGRSWSEVAMAEGMAEIVSVRAVPSGVAAVSCGCMTDVPFGYAGDGFWYSSDGLDWSFLPVPYSWFPQPIVGSWGDHGFVVGGDDAFSVRVIASDGSRTENVPTPFNGAGAAAAYGDTQIAASGERLWLYQEPTDD